ncbi:GntR family transcriptional regulator [Clostridium sp. OM02-18AC]|uniref:GntR family transcriptional regulator n=1 Tax=Clostridium sp. OM02-18AC TaxID=2292311 RepID=UPI0015F98190|nr:GntR family transcriptional regulator [Clostridium sp. OM02-18AC]
MATKLKQIKIETTSEQVTSILRNAILRNQYKDGEALNLNEVAAELGVSNTPVRAAFQALANDGLIQLRPNKGAVVNGITPKRIRDYYQVRQILESHAAVYACDAEDMTALEEAFEDAEACIRDENWANYKNCNHAFHQVIWDMCGNDKMTELMSSLWISSSRSVNASEPEYVRCAHEEHKRIFEAILKRDKQLVYQEMQSHLVRSMNDVLTNLEK